MADLPELVRTGKLKPPESSFGQLLEDSFIKAVIPELGGVDINDIKDVGYATPIAIFYFIVFIFFITFFTVSNILTATSSQFLSLEIPPDAICETVPTSITSSFKASYDGYWETDSKYLGNRSIFLLEFLATQINNEQYTKSMLKFKEKMKVIGNLAKRRNAVYAVQTWAGFGFTDVETGMTFKSTSDPGIIFDLNVLTSALSSRYGICRIEADSGIGSLGGYFDRTRYGIARYSDFYYTSNPKSSSGGKLFYMFQLSSKLQLCEMLRITLILKNLVQIK